MPLVDSMSEIYLWLPFANFQLLYISLLNSTVGTNCFLLFPPIVKTTATYSKIFWWQNLEEYFQFLAKKTQTSIIEKACPIELSWCCGTQ
jgi:hypothetical protein